MSAVDIADERPALSRQDSILGAGVDSRFCCNICFEAVVEPVVTQCGHLYCWPCLYRWLEPGMQPEERSSLGLIIRRAPFDASRRVCPVCKSPCSVPTLVPIYVRSHQSETTAYRPAEEKSTDDGEQENTETNNAERLPVSFSESNSTDSNGDSPVVETVPSATNDANDMTSSFTGLRQRFRSRDSDIPAEEESVPSRPPAQSPRPSPNSPSTPQQGYRSNSWMTPLTPNGSRGSLSYGLLLSFQQAAGSNHGVPPLHRRDAAAMGELDAHPDATEYLSRLLIMLASFVILCLLLL